MSQVTCCTGQKGEGNWEFLHLERQTSKHERVRGGLLLMGSESDNLIVPETFPLISVMQAQRSIRKVACTMYVLIHGIMIYDISIYLSHA